MSFDVAVRTATSSDLPLILSLETVCHTVTWSPASFEEEFANSNTIAKVVFVEGTVLAGYCLCSCVVDECTIDTIAVLPKYRRQGIGKLLCNEIQAAAEKRGVKKIFLEVRSQNSTAKEFYHAMGFKRDGVRTRYYNDTNEDAILMSLGL